MEDARVHCVVLKVRAVPTPATETTAPRQALEEQTPTKNPQTPVSARPLRTQQRACINNSEPDRSSGKPRTKPGHIIPDTKSNVPPMSYQQHTFGAELAPGHSNRNPNARCSLERR